MSGLDPKARSLERIAAALERLAGVDLEGPLPAAPALVFDARAGTFAPVLDLSAVPLDRLCGMDRQKATYGANLDAFAEGRPAQNVLLWGARGVGKSALVKAAHAARAESQPHACPTLVEIDAADLPALPTLFSRLRRDGARFVVFCDDLSFAEGDPSARGLKTALEGGLRGRPENVIMVATSNRRHLTAPSDPRALDGLARADAVEETVSLSDRFALWIGFGPIDQAVYLDIVSAHARAFGLDGASATLKAAALRWAIGRGSRSGRSARQFIEMTVATGVPSQEE